MATHPPPVAENSLKAETAETPMIISNAIAERWTYAQHHFNGKTKRLAVRPAAYMASAITRPMTGTETEFSSIPPICTSERPAASQGTSIILKPWSRTIS